MNKKIMAVIALFAVCADMEIVTSCPTAFGRATHKLSLRVIVPFLIVALIPCGAIPGTDILISLSIPAYSTFISEGAIVAMGSITVYVLLKLRCVVVPSLPLISK